MKHIIIFSFLFFGLFLSVELKAQKQVQYSKTSTCKLAGIIESVYLHTDRDLYISGDNLFFKLYLNNNDSSSTNQISEYAYIVLRSQNINIVRAMVKIESKTAFGSIYLPDTLKSGVYQLLAFTNFMRNFSEKAFFDKNILIVNRFDKSLTELSLIDSVANDSQFGNSDYTIENSKELKLNIELEKDSFKVREKVKFKITNAFPLSYQGKVNVSISIKEINPLFDTVSNQSCLNSKPNMLLGQVRDCKILNPNPVQYYLPENVGIVVKGKIINNAQSIKDECIYISSPDTLANLQYAFLDNHSNFLLTLNNHYLGKDLFLKLRDNDSENADSKIILEDRFNITERFIPVLPKLSIELKKYIFKSQDIIQIQKAYNSNNLVLKKDSDIHDVMYPFVYETPTSVVIPSNFIPLSDFHEIISNLLSATKIVKEKKEYKVYMFNYVSKSFFNYQPAIFLDGVPIDNISQIIGLSSDMISKIELCNILKFKGELNFPGIMSVYSKNNLINLISFKKPYKKFKIEQKLDKAFYTAPNYGNSKACDNHPDFRQLLYWNPNVQVKQGETSEIELYASDYIAEYFIEIIGFTQNGFPVTTYAKIKIYR